jgi:prepilin-type N-terminal cleavage/methylation domain-containing protein
MSLLEVLVAMAIFAVLYAIAVPNLQAMRAPYAVESAAYQVAGHMNMARQRAIARNVRHRIVFSSSGYHIERETSPNTFVTDSGTFTTPHEVEIGSPSPANPVFNSRGMLAGDFSIPLSADGVGTRTVMTNVLGHSKVN